MPPSPLLLSPRGGFLLLLLLLLLLSTMPPLPPLPPAATRYPPPHHPLVNLPCPNPPSSSPPPPPLRLGAVVRLLSTSPPPWMLSPSSNSPLNRSTSPWAPPGEPCPLPEDLPCPPSHPPSVTRPWAFCRHQRDLGPPVTPVVALDWLKPIKGANPRILAKRFDWSSSS